MKRFVSVVVSTVLVAFGLVSTAAPASATTSSTVYYTITRVPDGQDILRFRDNENYVITERLALGPDWTGWVNPRPATMTFTQGELIYEDSTDPGNYYGNGIAEWHYFDSNDPESCEGWSSDSTLRLRASVQSESCADTIEAVFQEYSDGMSSEGSLQYDRTEWGILYGGVMQGEDQNAIQSIELAVTGETTTANSLNLFPENDTSVSFELVGCVDESTAGLADGDVVTLEQTASLDSAVISDTPNGSDPVVEWTGHASIDENGDPVSVLDLPNAEIQFAADPPQNVTVGVDGVVSNLAGESLSWSFDASKDGSSVLENCPINNHQGTPSIPDASAPDSTLDASVDTFEMPTGSSFDADNTADMQFAPDGFGGEFVYQSSFDGTASDVFHITLDGPDNVFGGGNGLELSSQMGLLEFKGTAWGIDGAKWATYHFPTGTTFRITTGTDASSSVSTVTASLSKTGKVCGKGWSGWVDRLLPVQSSTLLAQIGCYKFKSGREYTKTVIAKLNPSSTKPFIKVATFGKPSKKYPVTCVAIGIDPTATGTEAAIVGVTRQLKYTKDTCDQLPSKGQILVTRVTAKAKASTKKVKNNPLRGGSYSSWPTNGMTIIAGGVANTWVGVETNDDWTYDPDTDEEFLVETQTMFTISSRGKIVEGTDVASEYRFGSDRADSGTLLAAPDPSTWVFGHTIDAEFDSDFTMHLTASMVDTATGDAYDGEEIVLANYGSTPTWMYWSMTTSVDGTPLYYTFSPDGQYSVVRWDFVN